MYLHKATDPNLQEQKDRRSIRVFSYGCKTKTSKITNNFTNVVNHYVLIMITPMTVCVNIHFTNTNKPMVLLAQTVIVKLKLTSIFLMMHINHIT